MELSDIRKQIDEIDSQLLPLFLKRMECSSAVAEYKAEHNLPVLNAQRENEILDRLSKEAQGNETAVRLLYSTIMDVSRMAQYGKVSKGKRLAKQIEDAKDTSFTPKTVACQGVAGAYSHIGAKKLYENCEISFFDSFEDVFKKVADGEFDCGIVPIENSYAGSVVENYDLLLKYNLYINKAINLPIEHCLVAKEGATLESIKDVYSHNQGLLQCAEFIKEMGYNSHATKNTAVAARSVAESNDTTIAAIASSESAEIYGLNILKKGVQSSKLNSTRFVVVARKMQITKDCDHVSVAFPLPHVAGTLHRTLSKLAAANLNLTKIESRPMKSSPFSYLFYLDFCGNLFDKNIQALLSGMEEEIPDFTLLGNYKIL